MSDPSLKRCAWCEGVELNREYHDSEWGVPVFDDRTLFEFLILEGAQAGLSWTTILKKRSGYLEAFYDFDVERVAQISDARQEELRHFDGIVRNRLKISSTVGNAQAFIDIQKSHGSFCAYLWAFVDGSPIDNSVQSLSDIPAETPLSKDISQDLKRRGFRFVGPTIVYAYMQAVGMVNDHEMDCFRHPVITAKNARIPC